MIRPTTLAAIALLAMPGATPAFAQTTPVPLAPAPAPSAASPPAATSVPATPPAPTAAQTPADASAAPAATDAPAAPSADATSPVITGASPDTGPKLTDFPGLFFSGTVGESAPELTQDLTTGTMLGAAPLLFEKTKLDDLASHYGGTLHSSGDAGDAVTWLCLTQHAHTKADTPRTVWFTSTNEMADTGHTLSMVMVENVDAAKKDGCATAPKGFAFPTFSVPAVGATLADLKQKYGSNKRDRQGNVYYDSTLPTTDGSKLTVYQAVGYRVNKKGIVTGFALSQVTTN